MMGMTIVVAHAPTGRTIPAFPSSPADMYYAAIDDASSSYQRDVEALTALAQRRWRRSLSDAARTFHGSPTGEKP